MMPMRLRTASESVGWFAGEVRIDERVPANMIYILPNTLADKWGDAFNRAMANAQRRLFGSNARSEFFRLMNMERGDPTRWSI